MVSKYLEKLLKLIKLCSKKWLIMRWSVKLRNLLYISCSIIGLERSILGYSTGA